MAKTHSKFYYQTRKRGGGLLCMTLMKYLLVRFTCSKGQQASGEDMGKVSRGGPLMLITSTFIHY